MTRVCPEQPWTISFWCAAFLASAASSVLFDEKLSFILSPQTINNTLFLLVYVI